MIRIIFVFLICFCVEVQSKEVQVSDQFFVLTGGPGSGKTVLIEELKRRGVVCVDEVARKIIQDEMAKGEDAVPSDVQIRVEKMLIRSIETYQEALKEGKVTVFDRGILDYLAYADHTNTKVSDEFRRTELIYNKKVFILPPWEEIFCNDTERKQTFEEAVEVYQFCFNIYTSHGYEVIVLPKVDINARADFIINEIYGLN